MIGIQLLGLVFVLGMSYFSYLHFRRREYGLNEYLFWQILWLGLLGILFFPHSVTFFLRAFNISRTFDLVVVVGMMILFGATFRNFVLLRRMEHRLEKLVRDDALRSADSTTKTTSPTA